MFFFKIKVEKSGWRKDLKCLLRPDLLFDVRFHAHSTGIGVSNCAAKLVV
jgi:hypothetical protein